MIVISRFYLMHSCACMAISMFEAAFARALMLDWHLSFAAVGPLYALYKALHGSVLQKSGEDCKHHGARLRRCAWSLSIARSVCCSCFHLFLVSQIQPHIFWSSSQLRCSLVYGRLNLQRIKQQVLQQDVCCEWYKCVKGTLKANTKIGK